MKDFDPYEILGVARTAAPAAVKAAYRKRVQTAHPDRGGSHDAFVALVKAFGVLSDPEARRLFDETGLVDHDGIRNYRQDMVVVLADMFDAAVQTAIEAGLKLPSVDFIALMTKSVEKSAAEAASGARKIDADLAALTSLRGRIKRNDDNSNLFVERLTAQITQKTARQAELRRRVFILETAIVELGNYESELDLISALQAEA